MAAIIPWKCSKGKKYIVPIKGFFMALKTVNTTLFAEKRSGVLARNPCAGTGVKNFQNFSRNPHFLLAINPPDMLSYAV
ncbi:MAG: hypothetical protein ACYTFK_06115 [Planctomycetota bacterium]|jgi:hypothetical protein